MTRDADALALAFWTQVAWSHAALPPTSRLLLLAVAYLANPAGNVTITDGGLADVMRVGIRTVWATRNKCERRGAVEIRPERRRRRGTREGLTYQLLVRAPAQKQGTDG